MHSIIQTVSGNSATSSFVRSCVLNVTLTEFDCSSILQKAYQCCIALLIVSIFDKYSNVFLLCCIMMC